MNTDVVKKRYSCHPSSEIWKGHAIKDQSSLSTKNLKKKKAPNLEGDEGRVRLSVKLSRDEKAAAL